MQRREFEGKDLDEALHAAAAALGIDEPDLDYEIVEAGRRGLFGVGAKSVRIRVKPPLEEAPQPVAANELLLQEEAEKPADKPRRRRRDGRGRRRSRSATAAAPQPPPSDTPPSPATELEPPPGADQVVGTLERMFDLMGMEVTAQAVGSDNGLALMLEGPDRKLLTQKDGELLGAMQFLLNRMARRAWPDAGRIQLSCNGQRRNRDEDLVAMTREVAQQVSSTGQTKRLQPMNAYERRLVHLTVREFEELGSRSEGNGHLKRVQIYRQNRG
jgi:spoIIIJ-associated protein